MRIQINTFAFIAADATSAADKHRHAAEYTDNQRVIMYLILLAKNVPLPCGVLLTPPGVQCDNCATKWNEKRFKTDTETHTYTSNSISASGPQAKADTSLLHYIPASYNKLYRPIAKKKKERANTIFKCYIIVFLLTYYVGHSIVSLQENLNHYVSALSSIFSHLLLQAAEPLTDGWQRSDKRQVKTNGSPWRRRSRLLSQQSFPQTKPAY